MSNRGNKKDISIGRNYNAFSLYVNLGQRGLTLIRASQSISYTSRGQPVNLFRYIRFIGIPGTLPIAHRPLPIAPNTLPIAPYPFATSHLTIPYPCPIQKPHLSLKICLE